MTRRIILGLILLLIRAPAISAIEVYDFDSLNNTGDNSKKVHKLNGAKELSDRSQQRQQRQWQEEAEAERRAAAASAERYRAERALGNGNRYYDCEFSCRTNGFLLAEGTDKFHQRVKADESWEAERIVKSKADELCRSVEGTTGFHKGESMWETGLRCTEVR